MFIIWNDVATVINPQLSRKFKEMNMLNSSDYKILLVFFFFFFLY